MMPHMNERPTAPAAFVNSKETAKNLHIPSVPHSSQRSGARNLSLAIRSGIFGLISLTACLSHRLGSPVEPSTPIADIYVSTGTRERGFSVI